MYSLSTLVAIAALSTSVFASPWGPWGHRGAAAATVTVTASAPASTMQCLSDADAEQVSDAFFIVTGGKGIFNLTVANAILAEDFSDTSQAVASIVNGGASGPLPLYGPTFSSKKKFNEANAIQPKTTYKALQVFHNCRTVTQRFAVTNLSPQRPHGISIFETVPAPAGNLYPFQIKQVYGEINSIAWLVDLDYSITNSTTTANTTAKVRRDAMAQMI